VQAQVLNLLAELQETLGLTYLFISHDLAVVNHLCDEVAVMYAGRIVEQGTPGQLFQAAAHPYTRALVGELPRNYPYAVAPGSAPAVPRSSDRVSGMDAPAPDGCAYAARCRYRHRRCEVERPLLRSIGSGHDAACHVAESVIQEL
jgi:peptide/nickel transport system ATP-binding protein